MSLSVQLGQVEVVEANGQTQFYTTQDGTLPERNPINIGNISNVDIQLKNKPTGRWHIQLFAEPCACKLYNLGGQPILIQSSTGTTNLLPRAQHVVPYNKSVKLDDTSFVFYNQRHSRVISLELIFPDPTELTSSNTINNPLQGMITLHNDGEHPEVQFNLRVEGLPPDAYQLGDSNPKLAYVRQESIKFWVYHPEQLLTYGQHCVTVYAEAPFEYPREIAVGFHPLYVKPHYAHALKFS